MTQITAEAGGSPMLATTMSPSYIYAIKCSSTGYIKIGMSSSPKERRNSLQIGTPHKLELLRTWGPWLSKDARYVERLLHGHFKSNHKSGEWFSVALADIEAFCK